MVWQAQRAVGVASLHLRELLQQSDGNCPPDREERTTAAEVGIGAVPSGGAGCLTWCWWPPMQLVPARWLGG